MPTIRVSAETLQRLKRWAEPLKDTAESAISKALDVAEKMREDEDRVHAAERVAKEPHTTPRRDRSQDKLPQKEFRQPLLEAIYEMGGSARTEDLRSVMEQRMKPRLLPGDLVQVSSGDERWWNAICWERNDLVKEGYLRDNSPRGVWELSDIGLKFAEKSLSKSSESFVDHLLAIPNVGNDADFERDHSGPRPFDI